VKARLRREPGFFYPTIIAATGCRISSAELNLRRSKPAAGPLRCCLRGLYAASKHTTVATSGQFAIGELTAQVRPVEFDKAEVLGSIPQRFRRQVAERGKAPAIRDRHRAISYAQLDAVSDRIAQKILAEFGAQPLRVGIVFPPTIEAIATHLGVLKAGKTCVCVDPAYPPARAADMLTDSGARLAICDTAAVDSTRKLNAVEHVFDYETASNALPNVVPEPAIDPDVAATIVYTSGSTGTPKGVVHTHRTLLHRCWSDSVYLQITPLDHIALTACLSFGAGLPQALLALLNGATVYPFDLRRQEFSEIYDWLWTARITVFSPPVQTFRQFLDGCPGNECYDDCRYVIQAGEATLTKTVAAWRRHFPATCTLVCELALTEAQIVSRFAITHDTDIRDRFAPIGYADCDKQLRIVDACGAPVSPGAIGELIVASPYLSPGYWSAPAQTVTPLVAAAHERTDTGGFRTRDLASHDGRGCLRHHGRSDGAVKLRGFQIDFAEVEAALLEYDGIADAVCVALELEDHRQQLIAFFRPHDVQAPASRDELRRWLRSRVPDYMVPARLLPVAELPRTVNGKLARCAVASLELVQRSRGADLHTFENELQRRFVEIWRAIIGHDDIGIDDAFFDIGGDTLSMERLVTAISRCIGRRVPVGVIARYQTIRRIVAALDRADDPITCMSMLPGSPARSRRRPLFCIYGLYRYRPLAEALGPGAQPLGVNIEAETHLLRTCSASGRASGQPAGDWPPSVEQMAAAYVEQIRRRQRTGPYQLIGAGFGGVLAFEMARQLKAAGCNVSFLGLLESFAPGAVRPRTPRGWLHRAADRALNSIPLPLPDTRADREALHNHRRRARDIAMQRYRPNRYSGNAVLFCAARRSEYSQIAIAPNLGWSELIAGQLAVQVIPGDSLGILRPPYVATLAATLKPFLDMQRFIPSALD